MMRDMSTYDAARETGEQADGAGAGEARQLRAGADPLAILDVEHIRHLFHRQALAEAWAHPGFGQLMPAKLDSSGLAPADVGRTRR